MDFETSLIIAIQNNDLVSLKTIGVDKYAANEVISKILQIPQKKGEYRISSVSYPTPLVYAICCRQFESVSQLISLGASLKKEVHGWSPFHFAVLSHDIKIAKLLLSKDKKLISKQSSNGSSPLHFAVSSSDLQMVLFLLKNTADPNSKNNLKQTPLHLSMCCTDIKITKALVAYGAKIDQVDAKGQNCEEIAKIHNKFEFAKYINDLNSGAETLPKKEDVIDDFIDTLDEPEVTLEPEHQSTIAAVNESLNDMEKRVHVLEIESSK